MVPRGGRNTARWVVIALAFAVGALFAAGSLLAILFELQGFPPRDEGPRAYYLAALVLALIVCVGGPLLLMRLLLPGNWRIAALIAVAVVLLALVLLGLTLRT